MPAPKFCTVSGCYEIAVREPRSQNHCRGHYATEILSGVELIRFEVTAQPRFVGGKARRPGVVDARTGQTVHAGGVVELDPAGTNIAALVAAGLGKVVPGPAAEATKAKKG